MPTQQARAFYAISRLFIINSENIAVIQAGNGDRIFIIRRYGYFAIAYRNVVSRSSDSVNISIENNRAAKQTRIFVGRGA